MDVTSGFGRVLSGAKNSGGSRRLELPNRCSFSECNERYVFSEGILFNALNGWIKRTFSFNIIGYFIFIDEEKIEMNIYYAYSIC